MLPRSWLTIDAALSQEDLVLLREELSQARLKPALQVHARGDHMRHVRETEAMAAGLPRLASAINLLKGVCHEIASAHGTDLTVAAKAQVACYPGSGTGYKRHRDNSVDSGTRDVIGFSNWRVFTVILYCNPHYKPEHGGMLRLYPGTTGIPQPATPWGSRARVNAHQQPVDVAPVGGRLVAFDSFLEHEVLPSHELRYAICVWIWREDMDEEKYSFS